MNIIIDFVLKNIKTNTQRIFWSCQLPSKVESFDKNFMNNENSYKLKRYADFQIVANYEECSEGLFKQHTENKNERPPVFLACNKIKNIGSPFLHCSAELSNWYCDEKEFQVELKNCIGEIPDSNYNNIQIETIEIINNIIGMDIFKSGSIPGSFAVYTKLPIIDISHYDFRPSTENRYQEVILPKELIDSGCFALVEIRDDTDANSRILYTDMKEFECGKNSVTFTFPSVPKLEAFGHIHIIVMQKKNNIIKRIFEFECTMITSFSIGIGVQGGKRLVRNRYKENRIEKIPLKDYSVNKSDSAKYNWHKIDVVSYVNLYGWSKEILESQFFDNSTEGRKEFLKWAEHKLSHARSVLIIDPFFDIQGLNDFLTCATGYFDLSILTTDPCETERGNENKKISDDNKYLVKFILKNFPKAKVYFESRKKLHDRYLIINDSEGDKVFSMSNSWNGTVNNYSLFIQELDLSTALKVRDFYSRFMTEASLQKTEQAQNEVDDENNNEITEEKEKYTKDFADNLIKKIVDLKSADDFYNAFYSLFKCEYYGSIDEENIDEICKRYLPSFPYMKELSRKTVCKLLTAQKKKFIESGTFKEGNILDEFDSLEKLFQRINQLSFSHISYYDLKLDYADYNILKYCFLYVPDSVIKELKEQEKTICAVDIEKDKKRSYYESELIIASFLQEIYYLKDSGLLETFIKTANSAYCKFFFANAIQNGNFEKPFNELCENLKSLDLSLEEEILLLTDLHRRKSIKPHCKPSVDNEYLSGIEDYVVKKCKDNKNLLLKFLFRVSIQRSSFNFNAVGSFLEKSNDNDIKIAYEQLLLLYVLKKCPYNKLYNLLVSKNVALTNENMSLIEENQMFDSDFEHRRSIVDVGEFVNYMPYLAHILVSRYLMSHKELINKIIYKFQIRKNIIFEIGYISEIDFDYFLLNIIMLAIYEMQGDTPDVSKEIKKIEWYIPFMLNACSDDYYGLGINLLDLYLSFLDGDDERRKFLQKIGDRRLMAFISAKITNKFCDDENLYVDVIENDDFARLDAPKKTIYLLNIFAGIILYTSEEKKEIIESPLECIKEKLLTIDNPEIKDLVSKGIVCYKNSTVENKMQFIEAIKQVCWQYSLESVENELRIESNE